MTKKLYMCDDERERRRRSDELATSFLAAVAGMGWPLPTPKTPLEGIDIQKEHELILQKRSSLPARTRALIERRFNERSRE